MKTFKQFITEKHLPEEIVYAIQDKIAEDLLKIIKNGNITDKGLFSIKRKAEHYVAIVVSNPDEEDENAVVQIIAMPGSSGEYLITIDIFLNKGSFTSLYLPYTLYNADQVKEQIIRYSLEKSFIENTDYHESHSRRFEQSADAVYKHFKDDFDVQASLF